MAEPFSYATLQIVPRVERGERFNAGVVLYCRRHRFLDARVGADARKLEAFGVDPEVQLQLEALAQIARGEGEDAVARLDQSERFHWLVAPSSTIVQPSPVHTGLTDDPSGTLQHLFQTLVA